jgi:hypothetical protein
VICQGFAERNVTDVGGIFGQLGVEYRAGAFCGYSAAWRLAEVFDGTVPNSAQHVDDRKILRCRDLGTISPLVACALFDTGLGK